MLSQACPGSAVSHKLRVEVKVVSVRCSPRSPVSGAVAPLCRLTPVSPLEENNTRRQSVHHVKHVPSVSTFLFACSFARHAVCVHKGPRRVCPDSGL